MKQLGSRPLRVRPRGRRGRGIATVAIAALWTGAAIIAGGCSAAATIDPVAQAAVRSTSVAGYRMKFTVQIGSSALPAPITATGTGSFQTGKRAGSLTLAMNFAAIPEIANVLGSSTLQMQEVLDGSTIYLKLPSAFVAKNSSLTKPWVRVDIGQAVSARGFSGLGSLFDNPTSADPGQMLQYLRGISGQVTRVGSESIDGVQTTGYRAQIDFARVPDAAPAASRAAVRRAISSLERLTGARVMPVTVWIDGRHLVRRMEFALNVTLPGGQSLTESFGLDVTDYGPQPAPVLPPAGQVQDLTSSHSGSSS